MKICFVADTKDKNYLSATSLLLDLERPVWRYEGSSENSQIRIYRARKRESVFYVTATGHGGV